MTTLLATLVLGLTVGLAERCCPTETKPLGDHVWAIEEAGHTFVDLRATTDERKIAEMISRLDVLMLSGGEDVGTRLYGRTNTYSGDPNEARDAWEVALVREAVRQRKGVVGICRGCQMINVALGGTMCQHVPAFYGNKVYHNGLSLHEISIAPDSRLAGILGTNAFVNSWHHQCIERPAPGMRVVARTADGVPEVIEHETLPIAACQFHPEVTLWNKNRGQVVFQMFVQLDRWLGLKREKAAAAKVPFAPFADGETIVFLGDSISHNGRHTRIITDFYLTRWPEKTFSFVNAGVGGDTSGGCRGRLCEDVFPYKPSVIAVMFGMNDVGLHLYGPDKPAKPQDEKIRGFDTSLRALLEDLRAGSPQARLALMTPSPFDESRAPGKWVGSNSKGLTALAEVVRKLGAEKGIPVVDFHAPMTAFNRTGQKRDPNFSICGRDRIHPELPGSMFMAFEFLKAQNVPSLVAEIHLDAAGERDSGSQNADVSDIRAENGGLSFTVLEKALPLVVPVEAEEIAREIGFNLLNDEVLSVSGLPEGTYDLVCDGETLGRYSEVTLAAGIDLASLTNAPGYRQAREVENRNERRCTFESIRLRKLACVRWFLRRRGVDPDDFAAVRKFYAKLSPDARKEYFESIIPRYLEDWPRRKELFAELDGLARAVDAVRRPTPHRWQVVPCAVGAAPATDGGNVLWYDKPAPDSDAGWERESLPLGNGWFGVSVFGGVSDERLQVTENTFHTCWNLTSALDIRLRFPGHDFARASDYRRDLDLDTGLATVSYRQDGVLYRRTAFASYPDRVLVVRLTASKPGALAFALKADVPYQQPFGDGLPEKNGRMGTVMSVDNALDVEQHLQYYNVRFFGRLAVETDGRTANTDGVLSVTNATSAVVYFSCGTNYRLAPESFSIDGRGVSQNKGPAPRDAVVARVDAARAKGADRLLADHLADFGALMRRVRLTLPGGAADEDRALPTDRLLAACAKGRASGYLESLYFQYGRYLLVSSSRVGTMPANLQGTWCGVRKPGWGCGYWYNINVQMNYWPAFCANLAECFEPFARFHAAFRPITKPIVAAYLKRHGLGEMPTGPEASDIWCVGTAVFPYVIDGGPGAHSGPGTSGLTTRNYIDWWEFTRDEKALKEYIWPTVHGTAAFFLKCVTETNGLYLSKFSASPEQMLPGVEDTWEWGKGKKITYYHTVGCTFDQSLIWENNRALLTFADFLGTNDAVIAAARRQIDRYDPIQIGADGQLKEYREENHYGDYGQKHHRHLSQLVGLYPGTLVNKNRPDWMAAAKVSLDLRGDEATGWGLAHRLNCRARLGDGDHAYKLIRLLLGRKTYPNLWDVHPPFQIDGNFGATSGIAEMLLQSQAGFVDLLPALPKAWAAKGSFRGLCARNRMTVDCAWEDGRPVRVTVTAPAGVRPDVRFAGRPVPFDLKQTNGKD